MGKGAVSLHAMMEAAKMPLPVHVEYDEDGGGEYGPYSRWAYRIPGICNLAEETDSTWPELTEPPDSFDGRGVCPRSEYIAEVLNAMPELLAENARLRAVVDGARARFMGADPRGVAYILALAALDSAERQR